MYRFLHIGYLLAAMHLCFHALGQEHTDRMDAGYPRQITKKVQVYNSRLTTKTTQTLARLSRWENRIKKILEKSAPETAQKLFAPGEPSFSSLLQQIRQGETITAGYASAYNQYMDELGTGLKYFDNRHGQANNDYRYALTELDSLNKMVTQTERIKHFISQRKKQLLNEGMKHAGSSKAFKKLNREAWYYTETVRNYRELFEEPGKREQLAKKLLSELPAYQKFARENSMLASLFAVPQSSRSGGGTASLAGLQTRAGVQELIQQRISAAGPEGAAQIQRNLQEAQSRLTGIKDQLLKGGQLGSNGEIEMPGFKPNGQRSKTFLQRLEYGFDIQFGKNNTLLPATSDIGLSIGYKLNDRSVMGAGISYRLGLGRFEQIRLSSEGVGLRSYLDWKIKVQWYAAGGFEANFMSSFKNIDELKDAAWQKSGLLGISRQYKAGKKLKGEVKLLYDFLHRQHMPQSVPVVFRVGYKPKKFIRN